MARKRNYDRRNFKERRKKQIVTRVLLIIAAIIVTVGGLSAWNNYKEKKAAEEEAARIAAEKKAEEERLAKELKEKQDKINSVLETDIYKSELSELYNKYTQTEEILLNREAYPDWVIEYLAGHEEAIDWAVGYPEYMAKSVDEINALATTPIGAYQSDRNNIPLLFQWDQRWGYASYGETGIIARDGCGPTCLSMIAIGFTGDDSITPKVVADMAAEKNHYIDGGGSSWSLFGEAPKEYGLSTSQITRWSATEIADELASGNVVVCNVGPGDFTAIGHYIVITKLNEDGTVMVNDPNSKVKSEMNWDPQKILDQTKGMWSIGR